MDKQFITMQKKKYPNNLEMENYYINYKKIIFNFRENDLLNDGEGAPLTPIFHQLIISQKKINLPVYVLNIGGISNITLIKKYIGSSEIFSRDIGPGNCLIDSWVRKNQTKNLIRTVN